MQAMLISAHCAAAFIHESSREVGKHCRRIGLWQVRQDTGNLEFRPGPYRCLSGPNYRRTFVVEFNVLFPYWGGVPLWRSFTLGPFMRPR